MALSRDSILKHAGTTQTKVVHVEEWADESGDSSVILRSMTIKEFQLHQGRLAREKDDGLSTARLLARHIVDEQMRRVFSDEDAKLIGELPLGAVLKLSVALNEVSGIGGDEESQAAIDADIEGESEAQTSSS